MSDTPVKLPDHVVDELYRAAKRTIEEIIRLTDPDHDGTTCILVPEKIMDRLESIVTVAGEHVPVDWRPA